MTLNINYKLNNNTNNSNTNNNNNNNNALFLYSAECKFYTNWNNLSKMDHGDNIRGFSQLNI